VHKEYETIIIGGGIVGSGIAYHLSEIQRNGVAVFDRGFPTCGTSGATQAWVWVHRKTPAWYGELSWYSAELYKELHHKIGHIEYKRTGGIAPFFTEEERETAWRLAESQAKVGIEIEVLDRDQAVAREPALSREILGATYCAADGNVNPFRVVQQYMRAAKKNGVTYEAYNEVTNIEKKQGTFVVTSRTGSAVCKNLVISAGVHTAQIGKMIGIAIPVRPVRGQVLITEPLAPLLKHTLAAMRQTVNGEILVGFSKEEAGFDRRTTLDMLREGAQLGIRVVPALAKARVVRGFAGLRVMPKDELPILGPVPGIENLYIAAMHSGVTLSPLVGTLMTELLCHQETSLPIDKMSITRFAECQ
jgi:sarcosine oxidase subunit beta